MQSVNPVIAAYDRDQVCVCGALAHFGFGPPLVRSGTVWACMRHRADIDRSLASQVHDDLFGKEAK